ncbi:ExeM/NucH family extracellular endonuclease [Nocardioides sp. YIM 152315]|uniref:ExeM/NucH family extracellular endonuclease n=1 Tax=Nocardioides sp. YIM 152315 TaxID=3031760 RepID=UPI0023DBF656|nr:ExeM/NucH family extracellular endonuclease [Nocardioides sp. YIM 152315]MDF1605512.1 ExeM/NucH family extracellular endonuclease [Nocardioides sp. YIM 152315]
MSGSRKRLARGAALAVVASGLLLVPSAPASAVTGVFVSEIHYDNQGTDSGEFVEVTAPAGTDLAGYQVVLYNGSNGTTYDTDALTGVVTDQQEGWGTAVLDYPSNGIQNGDPDGVALVNGSGTVVEFLSYDGDLTATNGPANGQTATDIGVGQTNSTPVGLTLQRQADGSWTGPAESTKGAPNGYTAGDPEPTELEAAAPADQSVEVDLPIAAITLTASGGTAPYTWTSTALPEGLELDAAGGEITGTPTTVGSTEVTATVTDSASPAASVDVTFAITVTAAPSVRAIAEVQGTGARSPFAPESGNGQGAEVVTVRGVVTAMYRTGGLNGMYVQTEGTGGDAEDTTPGASDAIFVYGGSSMGGIPSGIGIGDSVRVSGRVSEFYDSTQITPAGDGSGVLELASPLAAVEPLAVAYPTTDAAREALEGTLLAPTGEFVVSNSYSTNQYAEVGLAATVEGVSGPLKQPTEYVVPSDDAGIAAIKAENHARGVVLDDGASVNYMGNQATKALPLPYLTNADNSPNPIRVGAVATLQSPVVLEWRNDVWKFQPRSQVTTDGADVVTFTDTRTGNLVPQDVGGDLEIATFNVLNYFNTTGEAYVAAGPQQDPPVDTHCTYYTDRQSNRIGNNQCGTRGPGIDPPNDGRGPRGAATEASLARQEAKLVHTINALDADIIGLEEIENSIKLPGEGNRDDAVAGLVAMLNDATGEQTWGYAKSPSEALTSAAIAEQDVIRAAFIYKRDAVETVGQSRMLFGTTEFTNAREPLAQAFKAKGAPDSDAFAVIVNHFKSKGDNQSPAPPATGDNANDTETGVGAFNGDRTRQAQRLVQFAEDFAAERGTEAVFLAGDFNSYTMEDPIKVLEGGGFELIESDDPSEESYSFSGLSGSLDHVLGNAAAMEMVRGADIWEINANESVAFQYSRYNYNVTDFWQPNLPFATSDHNPEIVGVDVPDFTPVTYDEVQVIGTNDFHGRLLPDAGNAAGAAPFATAVKELRGDNPNSIFVAAGDLVGASTFESFIQDDEPTIEALNAMGLEVSAAGNHEFDRGYADLAHRIRGLADWEYLAANLAYDDAIPSDDRLAETWTKTMPNGTRIGFVGAVTEDLPALVNPAGIEGVTVTDVVDATNEAAAALRSGPDAVDLVILLVHEGAPTTDCTSASFTDPATVWGNIVQNTSADVDAIISGHTHLAYNCRYPVAGWSGRPVTKRPVVSAGQYGTNLNKLVFKYDEATGELAAVTQEVVAAAGVGHEPDPAVDTIVEAAKAYAATEGAKVLGNMAGSFHRASYLPEGNPATENRGGESTLGNQVAEVQRWATQQAGIDTDLAFMNPGGLRADMEVNEAGELTFREAADVQPFANTLVNMKLTGAQIETVLEQQWQRNAQGGVPSRPFLRLGVSQGFTYTYEQTPVTISVPNAAPVDTFRGEVTGMWLDGQPIDPDAPYSVTVNSFLGSGGDNFWELAHGTGKVDTGKVDLEAMVDYMRQYDADAPLPVDYSQRAVEVTFPADAPTAYLPGATVAFDVASWAMSAAGDRTDTAIQVKLGDAVLGTATVDNTVGGRPYDDWGTASVAVALPAGVDDGPATLTLVGEDTGTEIAVAIRVDDGVDPAATVAAGPDRTITWDQAASIPVTVTGNDGTPTGVVRLLEGTTELASAQLAEGAATLSIAPRTLEPGAHDLRVVYDGPGYPSAHDELVLTVDKAASDVSADDVTLTYGRAATVTVRVPAGATGTVRLLDGTKQLATGTVSNGTATLRLPARSIAPGTKTLTASYTGDSHFAGGSTTFSVQVDKAESRTWAAVIPGRVEVKKTRATVLLAVTTPAGVIATGRVDVAVPGQGTERVTLWAGLAALRLDRFTTLGPKRIEITYRGNDVLESSSETVVVDVVKPGRRRHR